jgi:hypothetical protein
MKTAKFGDLLRALVDADVEHIVVGMLAGVLQGVPVTTGDVDIVHRRTPENVDRLLSALAAMDAVARHDRRRLRPGPGHLLGTGHILLETKLGDLDCLCTIDEGRTYEDLIALTVPIRLDETRTVRVLALPELVEIKRRAGRPKDLAVIPYLESVIEERSKNDG